MDDEVKEQEVSKDNNKQAFWKNPVVILTIAIIIIVGAVVVLFITNRSSIDEGEDTQETTTQNQEDGGSGKSVKLNARSLISGTNIEIINKGDLIAFIDVWGGYNDKESVQIVVTTPQASSANSDLVPADALENSTYRITDTAQEYFLVLEEGQVGSENIEDTVMREFLSLFYQANVDAEVDEVTEDEFIQEGINILSENEHFVVN